MRFEGNSKLKTKIDKMKAEKSTWEETETLRGQSKAAKGLHSQEKVSERFEGKTRRFYTGETETI